METLTVDVITEEGMRNMQELERKRLIILHRPAHSDVNADLAKRAAAIRALKGTLKKQSIESVAAQLNDLRSAWE